MFLFSSFSNATPWYRNACDSFAQCMYLSDFINQTKHYALEKFRLQCLFLNNSINNRQIKNTPLIAQGPGSQVVISHESPVQDAVGAEFPHCLVLLCFPVSQVTEHIPFIHSPHSAATVKMVIINIFILYLSQINTYLLVNDNVIYNRVRVMVFNNISVIS